MGRKMDPPESKRMMDLSVGRAKLLLVFGVRYSREVG
jgi:hypothetical protein